MRHRAFSSFILVIALLCVLLSGCANASVSEALESANGAVKQVTDTGMAVKKTTEEIVDDVSTRITNVQEGIQKISDGKAQIEKGITGR